MNGFIYNNLEYITAIGGTAIIGGGMGLYKFMLNNRKSSNNLRRFVIKYKKQQDGISKQVKGMTK